MNLRPEEISSVIKEQIKHYHSKFEILDYGTILQVGDGIARVYGLSNCMEGELLEFDSGVHGMALNLEEDNVGVVILGADRQIKEGDIVKPTGEVVEVPVGETLIGRVAVSYTHLDVYKRQATNCGRSRMKQAAPWIRFLTAHCMNLSLIHI